MRETGACIAKIGEPDEREGMKVCGVPVEYRAESLTVKHAGWYHVGPSHYDHRAVPKSWA
jgi:hypothetical protein